MLTGITKVSRWLLGAGLRIVSLAPRRYRSVNPFKHSGYFPEKATAFRSPSVRLNGPLSAVTSSKR